MKKEQYLKNNPETSPVGAMIAFHADRRVPCLRRKSAKTAFVELLRRIALEKRMPLLGYLVTDESVRILAVPSSWEHLISFAGHLRSAATVQWRHGRDKKERCWAGRVDYTLVQGIQALKDCIVELAVGPVTELLVDHPCQHQWSPCNEMTGIRKRYRLLDYRRMANLYGVKKDHIHRCLAEAIEAGAEQRKAGLEHWEKETAVGAEEWIRNMAKGQACVNRTAAVGKLVGSECATLKVPVNERRGYINRMVNRRKLFSSKTLS